jgi:regulator of replication initiation timing
VLRETTFRKISKTTRQKWGCAKCKFSTDVKTKSPTVNVKKGNEASVLTNESFINLTDSVKYMSDKFDSFEEQLQDFLNSMKDMREENRILKVQNNYLRNDLNILSNKLNILEQKSLDNFVEIVNVPEIKNEDYKNTVKKIAN